MKCDELQTLIHGYADAELDAARNMEIEQHLRNCASCAEAVQQIQALGQRIQTAGLYQRAPLGFYDRIRDAVRRQAGAPQPSGKSRIFEHRPSRWLAIAASLALVAIAGWGISQVLTRASTANLLAQDVVANHVRSMLANHLMDVASSDQHTVKPWFNGQLDFSPPVRNLDSEGFPLVGGRLDYLDGRIVAALVYKRQQHVINLFVWPSMTETEEPARTETQQGYHLIHWSKDGFAYWAISDLNEQELQTFSNLISKK